MEFLQILFTHTNIYNSKHFSKFMPTQDTSKIKEKIISIIQSRGPTIPSTIASEIQTSILFTSAFLSELLSEKKLKLSNMKIGNSPIYLIQGQENQLEKFAIQYLKSKEKDAFLLLKEKKILKDIEQEPAIRVALRSIKDFAIPIKPSNSNEIFWRYLTTPEEEFEKKEISEITSPQNNKPQLNSQNENENNKSVNKEEIIEISDKQEPKKEEKSSEKRLVKKTNKKISQKANEKFFNKVKEHLSNNQIEISDIISFSKNDLILKIFEKNQEKLLVAYNKKSIKEEDLLKANKKAEELKLNYQILNLGEPTKKLMGLIQAIQNLNKIEKIN